MDIRKDSKNHAKNELTKREDEVLDYIIQGLSNKEIAEKLTVTSYTSKAHVSAILRKFGVKSRTAAARVGLEMRNKNATHHQDSEQP